MFKFSMEAAVVMRKQRLLVYCLCWSNCICGLVSCIGLENTIFQRKIVDIFSLKFLAYVVGAQKETVATNQYWVYNQTCRPGYIQLFSYVWSYKLLKPGLRLNDNPGLRLHLLVGACFLCLCGPKWTNLMLSLAHIICESWAIFFVSS